MPDRPLLILPRPVPIDRASQGGGGQVITVPSLAEQRRRLESRFQAVVDSFQTVQATPDGLAPEQVIVLETIGESIDGLAEAAQNIPGLEWIAELDLDDVVPQAGFSLTKDPTKELSCRLYAFVSNQAAIERLLGLWDEWIQDPTLRARSGFGAFKNLFKHLRDLRRWSAVDRLLGTHFVEDLQGQLNEGYGDVTFEVDLFCRESQAARGTAAANVRSLAQVDGAQALSEYAVPEIGYHGMLFRMPAANAQVTLTAILQERYTRLIQCEHVFLFRPQGQARIPRFEPVGSEQRIPVEMATRSAPNGQPVIALLDGLPLVRHAALDGRVRLDDPEGFAPRYTRPEEHCHGTAMASVILHGDLNHSTETLSQPIYARPIFVPITDLNGHFAYEGTPPDRLLVDLVHAAVRGLFESAEGRAVKVIHLALGNPKQPFDREMSPLARLLDWLAWEYRVLFLVSSGNHEHEFVVPCPRHELAGLPPEQLAAASMRSLVNGRAERRVLSPAESINAVTLGSVHADAATEFLLGPRIDAHGNGRIPSPLAAVGAGFRRALKPDVLLPGGRALFGIDPVFNNESTRFVLGTLIGPPGIKVAAPGVRPAELDRANWTCGSSNATALAAHLCGRIAERLQLLRGASDAELWRDADDAVLIKCLLIHGAAWGPADAFIEKTFRPILEDRYRKDTAGRRHVTDELRRLKADLLGYGEIDAARCLFCSDQRVTLLGWSKIGADQGQQFELPLPPALSAQRVQRTLTVTLAWCSPVNPKHRLLRRSQLWFDVHGENFLAPKSTGVDAPAARRGTVEHRIMTGITATPIGDADTLALRVNCKAEAGKLNERVPYALAATLELAEPLRVSIYDQMASRVAPRVGVRPR